VVVGIGDARQTGFVLARRVEAIGLVPASPPLKLNSSLFRSRSGALPAAADMSSKAEIPSILLECVGSLRRLGEGEARGKDSPQQKPVQLLGKILSRFDVRH
jgi:hypothetical protein